MNPPQTNQQPDSLTKLIDDFAYELYELPNDASRDAKELHIKKLYQTAFAQRELDAQIAEVKKAFAKSHPSEDVNRYLFERLDDLKIQREALTNGK